MTSPGFVLALPLGGPDRVPSGSVTCVTDPGELCTNEARLWVTSGMPVIGLGRAGCLVGWVMAKEGYWWTEAAPGPKRMTACAIATDLVADAWGNYCAIITDQVANETAILPDPSGLFPVYRLTTATHVLISNDVRLFGAAGAGRSKPSWSALGNYLLYPELRQRQTCLCNIDELPPGALCYPARETDKVTTIWQAAEFLPSDKAPNFEEAAEELRMLAVRVIGAWAGLLGPVAVASSGGVDSSFICGALARADTEFSCITLATRDASGDERIHARHLADHLDVRLAELIYEPDHFEPELSASAGLPRPSRRSFLTAVDALLAEGADSLGARTVLDGNAGDNLFCFLHSPAPVVDRLRAEGPGRGMLETLYDICRVTGCDIPAMAHATVRRLLRSPVPCETPDSRLLSEEPGLTVGAAPLVPWIDIEAGRHAGKRDHLALVMRAQLHVHGRWHERRFSPLMSQPILEFCLRIPTWTWVVGGRNRALARAAFRGELPATLLLRSSKAGPDAFLRGIFDRHRNTLRELLLDGELGRQGLLDRQQVEMAFNSEPARQGSIIYRLLDLVEAENWVRSWCD